MENNEASMVNVTEQVEKALQSAVTPAPVTGTIRWQTADEYRTETGKRFRMTKEELAQHGDSPEGRLNAFHARQIAGLL